MIALTAVIVYIPGATSEDHYLLYFAFTNREAFTLLYPVVVVREKITRVWLAENECIFHATRVQNCNKSAKF